MPCIAYHGILFVERCPAQTRGQSSFFRVHSVRREGWLQQHIARSFMALARIGTDDMTMADSIGMLNAQPVAMPSVTVTHSFHVCDHRRH